MNFGQPPYTQTLNNPSINDHNSQSPDRGIIVNEDYQPGSMGYNPQLLHANIVADNTTIAPVGNPSARGHTSRAETSPNAKRNKLVM